MGELTRRPIMQPVGTLFQCAMLGSMLISMPALCRADDVDHPESAIGSHQGYHSEPRVIPNRTTRGMLRSPDQRLDPVEHAKIVGEIRQDMLGRGDLSQAAKNVSITLTTPSTALLRGPVAHEEERKVLVDIAKQHVREVRDELTVRAPAEN